MLHDETGAIVRAEHPSDQAVVDALIAAAFAPMSFSAGTEVAVEGALRAADATVVSLVAERDGSVVGRAVLSPATVGGRPSACFALGPVAVAPGLQRRGIGSRLVVEGLRRLRAVEAEGCLVLGDPGYYARFGFAPAPALAPAEVPAQFFMALPFGSALPTAPFGFHPAFGEGR